MRRVPADVTGGQPTKPLPAGCPEARSKRSSPDHSAGVIKAVCVATISRHACRMICHPPQRASEAIRAATTRSGHAVPVPSTPAAASMTAILPMASCVSRSRQNACLRHLSETGTASARQRRSLRVPWRRPPPSRSLWAWCLRTRPRRSKGEDRRPSRSAWLLEQCGTGAPGERHLRDAKADRIVWS
jgi:hypothetical protein